MKMEAKKYMDIVRTLGEKDFHGKNRERKQKTENFDEISPPLH